MVKVAIVQTGTVIYDTPATIQKVRHFVQKAAQEKANLILFPEAFIGGYTKGLDFGLKLGTRSEEGREEYYRYFQSAISYDGPESDELSAIAAEFKMYIVIGVIEKDGHTLYCSVFYYGTCGRKIGKHRKLVPTALERCVWGRGDGSTIEVFQTDVGKIGAIICWENHMPLLRTHYYEQGVEIYLAPTADDRDTWLSVMRSIALEGRCFVISACQFLTTNNYPEGHKSNDKSGKILMRGGSCAISPMGEVLFEPVFDKEALHVVDIDLADVVKGKFDLDTVGHYSRPDVFQLLVNKSTSK